MVDGRGEFVTRLTLVFSSKRPRSPAKERLPPAVPPTGHNRRAGTCRDRTLDLRLLKEGGSSLFIKTAPIVTRDMDESELDSIAAAWSDLPAAIRRAMLAMIEAAPRSARRNARRLPEISLFPRGTWGAFDSHPEAVRPR